MTSAILGTLAVFLRVLRVRALTRPIVFACRVPWLRLFFCVSKIRRNIMAIERILSARGGVLVLIAYVSMPAFSQTQSASRNFVGMWSDPPVTITGDFCANWCTDAGIERLDALLDDPKNDARPLAELRAEADNYQRENYIRPRLTDAA